MKLRNKLILSCAALAAVATTAVSTTYAWYTSNTTVTASGISANTNESGADLLMIADGLVAGTNNEAQIANLSWKTSIPNVNEYVPADGMVPLSLSSGTNKVLQGLDTSTGKTATGDSDANGYLHFIFYLRNASAGGATTVKMTLTQLDNVQSDYSTASTWATLPTKAVVKNEAYTNKLSKDVPANYKVDATRVLAVDLTTTVVNTGDPVVTENVYKLVKGDYLTDLSNDAATVNGASAVDYYNDVMGRSDSYEAPATAPEKPLLKANDTGAVAKTADWTLNNAVTDFVTVPSDTLGDASKYVKLDFKVYLDGWDVNCYDACQGQYFKMAFQFDVQ